MKQILLLVLLATASISFAQGGKPAASPSATVKQDVGSATVTIDYSRPALKGRKMMGAEAVPYGKVWRTGANKITNITFSKDVTVEGKAVPAGTYGLATIPTETDWTIILTKNAGQWGTYNYKESEDLLRVKVPSEKNKELVEYFTIGFTDFKDNTAKVFIAWENQTAKFTVVGQ
jgi:hypothetical protein